MKTLVINGSPRIGDTSALVEILKQNLPGDVHILLPYYAKIKPCFDCRYCWENKGCVFKDDMAELFDNKYDNIIIASPIYCGGLPAPMVAVHQRLNFLYANKRFAKVENPKPKAKVGAIILVGGGSNEPNIPFTATEFSKSILKKINAKAPDENIIIYQNTDAMPATKNNETVEKVKALAKRLS